MVVKKYCTSTVRGDVTFWSAMKPVLFDIALRRHNGEDLAGILASVDKQFADWKSASASLSTVLGWMEPGTKCKAEGRMKPFETPPVMWPKRDINDAMLKQWEAGKDFLRANPKPPRKGQGTSA